MAFVFLVLFAACSASGQTLYPDPGRLLARSEQVVHALFPAFEERILRGMSGRPLLEEWKDEVPRLHAFGSCDSLWVSLSAGGGALTCYTLGDWIVAAQLLERHDELRRNASPDTCRRPENLLWVVDNELSSMRSHLKKAIPLRHIDWTDVRIDAPIEFTAEALSSLRIEPLSSDSMAMAVPKPTITRLETMLASHLLSDSTTFAIPWPYGAWSVTFGERYCQIVEVYAARRNIRFHSTPTLRIGVQWGGCETGEVTLWSETYGEWPLHEGLTVAPYGRYFIEVRTNNGWHGKDWIDFRPNTRGMWFLPGWHSTWTWGKGTVDVPPNGVCILNPNPPPSDTTVKVKYALAGLSLTASAVVALILLAG